jgi:putative transposase
MLTRRCSERRFFLRPSKASNNTVTYCVACAAARYQVDVYWVCAMSNHLHLGVYDRHGNYPEFLRYLNSLLARSNEQPGALHLADGDAVLAMSAYGLSNPVKDHLVDRLVHWPGVHSLGHQLRGQPMVATRPKWFFDEQGGMPERVELVLVRPPEFAHLSDEQWAAKVLEAVTEAEQKAAEERRRTGKRVLGRKAVLRQSPFSSPKSYAKRRGLRPRVATRNKWLRIELLQRGKHFTARYGDARERRRRGERDVVFPYGSYELVRRGLVRCEPPPALE